MLKNINTILILFALASIFLFKLYFYLVPAKNTTVLLSKDYCSIAKIVDQENDKCLIKGELRNDFFTSNYLFKASNGTEIVLNDAAVSGFIHGER